MAQPWKQLLDTSMQWREMSRAQAQRLVGQLVKEGQVAEEKGRAYVDELVERSRKRTEELRGFVRREIREQLSALGLATKDDLARLEKKLSGKAGGKTGKRASTGKAGSSGTSSGTSSGKTASGSG